MSEWTLRTYEATIDAMAKTTIVHITDDIDGSKDATEIAFSFDGTDYTVDLSKKNATAMEKALKPYLDAATKVTSKSTTRRRAKSSPGLNRDYAKIREWARENGLEVSDRGRIPATVVEQYNSANA